MQTRKVPTILTFTENRPCSAYIIHRQILRKIKALTINQMRILAPFIYNGKPHNALIYQVDRNKAAKERLEYFLLKIKDRYLYEFNNLVNKDEIEAFSMILDYRSEMSRSWQKIN